MPEYLTPGVLVEEVSFRAKSIEGVGTSTTAFVGVTNTGPYAKTPELLTSYGDFERVYGGMEDIADGKPNYLAHAVRAFFDNGGSRLYVSRVFPTGATPAEATDPRLGEGVKIVARFPGKGGDGEVLLYLKTSPVSAKTLPSAPVGSLLRLRSGTGQPARPAEIKGTENLPVRLPDGGVLALQVNGESLRIIFKGQRAEITSQPLSEPIALKDAPPLKVKIGKTAREQSIPVANDAPVSLATVADLINQQLRGGYARIDTKNNENRLVIGADVIGKAAYVEVKENIPLKFGNQIVDNSTKPDANNINDLGEVTAKDVEELLKAEMAKLPATTKAKVVVAEVDQKLVLRTEQSGSQEKLQVQAVNSPQIPVYEQLLGLKAAEDLILRTGTDGAIDQLFLKRTNTQPGGDPIDWEKQDGGKLTSADLSSSTADDLLTLTVVVRPSNGTEISYEDLGFDRHHPRWMGAVLSQIPDRRADDMTQPFAITVSDGIDAFTLYDKLSAIAAFQDTPKSVKIQNGKNGSDPIADDFRKALECLTPLEEISIVAAPGYSDYETYAEIQQELLKFVERSKAYQIVVLDAPNVKTLSKVRQVRSQIDSKYAALYYPWVVVANPLARPSDATIKREIEVPPSGFICGIYARNDAERGVYKAPANEVVRGALRFATDVNIAEQGILNPLGINCLRFFPGRGYRVWGARTISSDPEWKYVNVRRYFNYLEASLDRSTQWTVFEPNGPQLWSNVRDTISAFLYNEWVSGALLGSSPQEAYFVRCDRSIITQNDLDNGRLICLIGVAVIKPAEFVVFRIGQKTADSRS